MESRGAIPPAIATDRLRLRQILVNLLDNAIKFTDRGTVRLTVRTIDRPDADRLVQFAVADTGIGMAAAEMDRLFEPFYRIRSAVAGWPGGHGPGTGDLPAAGQAARWRHRGREHSRRRLDLHPLDRVRLRRRAR